MGGYACLLMFNQCLLMKQWGVARYLYVGISISKFDT